MNASLLTPALFQPQKELSDPLLSPIMSFFLVLHLPSHISSAPHILMPQFPVLYIPYIFTSPSFIVSFYATFPLVAPTDAGSK